MNLKRFRMKAMIGRVKEKKLLLSLFESQEAELVAVYGRRRIGKTFLIREVMGHAIDFELVGENTDSLSTQFENFTKALILHGSSTVYKPPTTWSEAFFLLSKHLESKFKTITDKQVVFLDEFPWLNIAKSGFLSSFDHWWNSWANKQDNLIVVICGSAAAWMIKHVVNNRGGLHNRITQRIILKPFTLAETHEFLKEKNLKFSHFQVVQLYMAIGGVAAYLKLIKKGESVAQAIDRLCFEPEGYMAGEFDRLYQSLFDHPENYIKVIRLLARNTTGLTRTEIAKYLNFTSGGGLTGIMKDLEASGFIAPCTPYGYASKNIIYKVNDEYSLFYLKFMEDQKNGGTESWHKIAEKPTWISWSGLAFERICIKHIREIKDALGLRVIHTNSSSWRSKRNEEDDVQIDLLIDRADFIINLCEMKFSEKKFTIDKDFANELRNKRGLFKEQAKTNKVVLIVMITSFGVNHNEYYGELVENEVKLEDLF